MAVMPGGGNRTPRGSGCFWWLMVFGVALVATAVAVYPYTAFGIKRAPQDHLGEINRVAAEQAGVAPADRGKPNAAADALARAVELTYQAHEEGLGVKIPRQFAPKWGIPFDSQALTAEEAAVIAAAQRLGLFAALDELAAGPGVYAPLPANRPPQAMVDAMLEGHSAMRQLARVNVARIRDAAQRGDGEALARAFAQNTALGRAAATRPFAIARLVAFPILSMGREEVARAVLAGKAPPAVLPALAKTLDGPDLPPARFVIETERQFGHLGLDQALGWSPLKSLNRDAVKNSLDELFDEMLRAAEASPAPARKAAFEAAAPKLAAICGRSPLLASMDQALPPMFVKVERDHDERVVILRTLIAVARFRADGGAPPATLDELVPAYLPAPPRTPEGEALVYEKSGPAGYEVRPPAAEATPRSESR